MESTIIRPRLPWLAALLGLMCGPLGQMYAGQLCRGIVLWCINLSLLPIFALCSVALRLGPTEFLCLLLCLIGFPVLIAIDAFFVAKKHRLVPLKKYQRLWGYVLAIIVIGIVCNAVIDAIRNHIAESFLIPTRSMSPTILAGDRILVDKRIIRPSELRRNDVVVFNCPGTDSMLFVMRVVGLPGDQVEIIDEKVFVNDEEFLDPHAFVDEGSPLYPDLANYGPTIIPQDSFFVLGDNRRTANDSRSLGPIPFTALYGKTRVVYWSRERHFPDRAEPLKFENGEFRWSRIGKRLD